MKKFVVSRNSMSLMVAWEPDGTELKTGFSEGSPRLDQFDSRIIAAMVTAGIGARGEQRGICLACGSLVAGSGRFLLAPKPFRDHVEAKH